MRQQNQVNEKEDYKMMQLYKYGKPDEMIGTVNGQIRYDMWLENERERIGKQPGRQCEIRTDGAMVALFVNRVAP